MQSLITFPIILILLAIPVSSLAEDKTISAHDGKKENLHVLTEAGESKLIEKGKVSRSYSDHLPIMIELETELKEV